MVDVNAMIAFTKTLDNRGVLVLACAHALTPPELHQLCVERWKQSEAAQAKFDSAEVYAAHMVGAFMNYQRTAQAVAKPR